MGLKECRIFWNFIETFVLCPCDLPKCLLIWSSTAYQFKLTILPLFSRRRQVRTDHEKNRLFPKCLKMLAFLTLRVCHRAEPSNTEYIVFSYLQWCNVRNDWKSLWLHPKTKGNWIWKNLGSKFDSKLRQVQQWGKKMVMVPIRIIDPQSNFPCKNRKRENKGFVGNQFFLKNLILPDKFD